MGGAPWPESAPIKVIVVDPETGDFDETEITDDYVITVAGSCYIHHVAAYANGTHVVTIKGRKRG